MPFDQSPMNLCYSYFITHFPGDVNGIFEIIKKTQSNFYNFPNHSRSDSFEQSLIYRPLLFHAVSSLCSASSRVLRWQA